MRRRILLTLLASTSIVLVAFLLPLMVIIGDVAVDRAQREIVLEVQPVVSGIPVAEPEAMADLLEAFVLETGHPATVYLPDGTIVGDSVSATPAVERARDEGAFFVDVSGGQALHVPIYIEDDVAVLRVVIPQADFATPVAGARLSLLALGLGLLALSVGLGLLLARAFLRPISNLAATAERLAGGDLSARVSPSDIAEIDQAGRALNRLASRVVELLGLERERVADLAHRLRTPVAALRLDADLLPLSDSATRLRTDVHHLDRMVDEVINEARRPLREAVPASADLSAVTRDRAAFWEVLAQDQGRALTVSVPRYPIHVAAESRELGDVLDALIGNVFAYTEEGVPFRVAVGGATTAVPWLEVSDEGHGFPSGVVVQRGLSVHGSTGLGLDIARRLAERTGGSMEINSGASGGACVRLHLTAAGAQPA